MKTATRHFPGESGVCSPPNEANSTRFSQVGVYLISIKIFRRLIAYRISFVFEISSVVGLEMIRDRTTSLNERKKRFSVEC